jgi:small subunit ribosomal protein S15
MPSATLVSKFKAHEQDSGSVKVQVAQLTERINELTSHLKEHKKDNDSRSGLLKMVGRRRRLLNYLQSREPEIYQAFIKELSLRK